MASIALESVRKTYPNGQVAVRGIDLTIADGEFMVLVGPSGCGKSTLLRLIAGLETPTGGRILIGAKDVTGLPPQERDVAMVFQSYALYPHMTVRENLAFGLRMRRAPRERIEKRVAEVAETLGLVPVLDRKPGQLSGGQRQRVALGRAIVREPQAFLFDEPLSNLDARLRVETRAELARLHRALGATSVYVTHDQEEAMTLGQRLAVMRDGQVEQVAEPMEIYRRPATVFVAEFIGSPSMNLFSGQVDTDGLVRLLDGAPLARPLPVAALPRSRTVVLGVRPHDLAIVAPDAGDVAARVDVVEPRGSDLLIRFRVEARPGAPIIAVAAPDTKVALDQLVGLSFDRQRLHWFDPETGRRLG